MIASLFAYCYPEFAIRSRQQKFTFGAIINIERLKNYCQSLSQPLINSFPLITHFLSLANLQSSEPTFHLFHLSAL